MSEKNIRAQNIIKLHAKIRDDKVAEMDAAEFNKWIDALPVGEFMALLDAPLAPPKRQVPERIEELCKKAILATFDLDKRRSMIILNVVGELRRATAKASLQPPQAGRVDKDMVERALAAFNKAINDPIMEKCARCDGKGYHHGFGEDGVSPDWCEVCGGNQYNVRPGEEARSMREALTAALHKEIPTLPTDGEA